MKIIFFGGVQGVGKSTLLARVLTSFNNRVKLVDPGEFFRRYFYKEKLKTLDEIEDLILAEISNAPDDTLIIAHWHYAVTRPGGFIPQIDFSRLRRLAESGRVEEVAFVNVEAPIETIYGRRLIDSRMKRRAISLAEIKEEVLRDREFLLEHSDIFSRVLGDENISFHSISNTDLLLAVASLEKLIKSMLI